MAQSKQVAGLLGPRLIPVSVTESLTFEIFTNTSAQSDNERITCNLRTARQ